MARLLLNLRNVPEDEADEVRAMLDADAIGWYETRPGPWGITAGGIWIEDDAAVASARALMAVYQQQRQARVRAEHAAAVRDGSAETFASLLRAEPARVVLALLGIALALALVALPVLLLLRH